MTKMNTYQFVVDTIPNSELDRFLDWMEQFRMETGCQFRYREKMGMKYTLKAVPPHKEPA